MISSRNLGSRLGRELLLMCVIIDYVTADFKKMPCSDPSKRPQLYL